MSTTVCIDVSDLLRHGARTGIQRVVGQVLPRLAALSDDELGLQLLRFDPVEHVYLELDTASMLEVLAQDAEDAEEPVVTGQRGLAEFAPTDVFLDLDSAWNSPLKRAALYPRLKDAGVTIVSYVYDLVPLRVPDVVHETTSANWVVYVAAVLAWSDLVLTDSRSAEHDLLELKEQLGVQRHLPTLVTRLGCDLPEVGAPSEEELALLEPLEGGRFALFVGTIEPRKEHLVALRAFDQVAQEHPDVHLVLAGRKGWIEDETLPTITGHPSYGERVHWLRAPSDALLAELYRRATVCLYLSRYEGYGLPIAEALAHGRVTIASYNSGMPEVGGDACDYTWHNLATEVAETLAQYLGDPELLAAREQHIRDHVHPLSWDTVADTISSALREVDQVIAASREASPVTTAASPGPGSVRNVRLAHRNERVLRHNELAHGPIRFASDGLQLLVAGLPQLLTVPLGTHVTLDLAHQLLGTGSRGHDVGLSFRVDDGPLGLAPIRRRHEPATAYASGFFALTVPGDEAGIHEVEFFLQLDGRPVRAAGRRYLTTLVVVGPHERPAKYYRQLAR